MAECIFACDIQVRESEIDALNGVANFYYYAYCSHSHNRMVAAIGWDLHKLHTEGFDSVIIKNEMEFKQSLYIDDKIRVYSDIKIKGSMQIVFTDTIVRVIDNAVVATSKWIGCVINTKTGEFAELTELREAIDNYSLTHEKIIF